MDNVERMAMRLERDRERSRYLKNEISKADDFAVSARRMVQWSGANGERARVQLQLTVHDDPMDPEEFRSAMSEIPLDDPAVADAIAHLVIARRDRLRAELDALDAAYGEMLRD